MQIKKSKKLLTSNKRGQHIRNNKSRKTIANKLSKNQYGGTIKDRIIQGYKKLINKGTQNCGVYYKSTDPNKILICNLRKIDDQILDFLIQNTRNKWKLYPEFYDIYHSSDTDEYFYLWEKMDGDLRDFFYKHIPSIILKKNFPDVTEKEIKDFLDFIHIKTQTVKLYLQNYQEQLNQTKYILLCEYDDSKLFYNKSDKEMVQYVLNVLETFKNSTLWDKSNIADIPIEHIMKDIVSETEKQLNTMIKIITQKRFIMKEKKFYTNDKKFDNIVYKIIGNNGDDYIYDFCFIDPESTLIYIRNPSESESALKSILNDLKNKYNNFKVSDAFPNIYDSFLTSIFTIYSTKELPENNLHHLLNNYLERNQLRPSKGEFSMAMEKHKLNINNVLPLQINTYEETLELIRLDK